MKWTSDEIKESEQVSLPASLLSPPLTIQVPILHISEREFRKTTFIRMSQEIRKEEGTPEPGHPWQSINFSNCYPINNTPVAKGGPGHRAASEAKAFIPSARQKGTPAFLPLCSPKPVPTPQMRQSKVWEHSPKIGVRHIHFFLASIHCGFEAIRPKRRGEKKKRGGKKGQKDPNYLLTPSRGNVLRTVWSQEQLGAWVRSTRPSL